MKRRMEQWQRVDSSCIHRMRYHQQHRTLDLEFPDGGQYEYQDVSPAEVEAMARSESIGAFINRRIKKHRFRRLNPEN